MCWCNWSPIFSRLEDGAWHWVAWTLVAAKIASIEHHLATLPVFAWRT